MLRQPGTARSQTIMIPPEPLALETIEAADRPAPWDGGWLKERTRWRDIEIGRLEALLSEESVSAPGDGGDATTDKVTPLIQALLQAPDRGKSMERLLGQLAENPQLVEAMQELDGATKLSSIIELARQRRGALDLAAAINNPSTTLEEFRILLRKQWWVFGGRYIPAVTRQRSPILEQVDLALVRGDATIHIVVLGPANLPQLVVPDASGPRVGGEVHALFTRAINELGMVEAQAPAILGLPQGKPGRATATIVIGHPYYADKFSGDVLRTTLRIYGERLNGIEIMTYSELLESAQASLDLLQENERG